MNRYIDAEALLNSLPDDLPYKASVKRVLMQAPTADAVEIVRCKDCIHRHTPDCSLWYGSVGDIDYIRVMGDNFYCSWGERTIDDGT